MFHLEASAGRARFNTKGLPILKVAKELNDGVRMVRENVVSILINDTVGVQRANPDAYKAQVAKAHDAGEPLLQADADAVMRYLDTVKAAQAATQVPVAEPLPVAA